MMQRLAALVGICLALLAASVAPGNAQAVINCHDPETDAVTRRLPHQCKGNIISDAEAEALRTDRAERLQRALKGATPVVPDRRLASVGTAFFVTNDGILLTNNHVIDNCAAVSITTTTDRAAVATVASVDPEHDLALLRTDIAAPASAYFDPHPQLSTGKPVALVGYPNQGLPPIKPLFTYGSVLSERVERMEAPRFSIRADVRHGNSGGPVLDSAGQVIGIIYAKVNTVKMYQATGKLIQDVGIAIPNRLILDFLARNRIGFRIAPTRVTLTQDQLFAAARPFIARVSCWK